MKRLLFTFLLFLLFSVFCYSSPKSSISSNSYNNATGYEFIVAFPQNEVASWTSGDLFIFVSSVNPTVVELQNARTNSTIATKTITKPYSVVQFRTPMELNMARDEVRIPYETPQDNKAFRIISSSSPVSVYCLNTKSTTSDGYMAIPVASWGTDYIHACYYDNNEGTGDQGFPYMGSGFVIMASENNTTVNIELKGRGAQSDATTGGRKIGDKWSVTLNRGQVYCVRGMGNQDGQFDLTGSRIKSDKPIGLLSYHQRADLPALISSSRDHLVEMLPPVSAWGKRYATIQLQRPPFKGDLFRIVAAENMTNYEVRWYDENTQELIERRVGTLKRSGDFAEFSEIMGAPGPEVKSIHGVSIFSANKPILVLQYAYSAGWDGNNNYDPFMIVTTAVEQFTNRTIFQTPAAQFNDNWFNIIAIGDTLDPIRHEQLIESIKLDGKPIYQTVPQFKMNRIPDTELYFARVRVGPGAHYVTGETPFGGYVYGFTSVDSYGWPVVLIRNELPFIIDTLPPEYSIKEIKTGVYEILCTELRYGEEVEGKKQVDRGINSLPELLTGSYNFKAPYASSNFQVGVANFQPRFILEVNDLYQNAVANFIIRDIAGNSITDKIVYNQANFNYLKLKSPENNANYVSRKPTFKWQNLNTSYNFYLSTDSASLKHSLITRLSSDSLMYPKFLKLETKYYWRVEPIDSGINPSPIWSFTTTGDLGSLNLKYPPDNSTGIDNKSLKFQWEDLGVTRYEFELSEYSDFSFKYFTNVYNSYYTFPNPLKEKTKYYWKVKAIEGTYSTTSETYVFTTGPNTSAEDGIYGDEVKIYPNPAYEWVTIDVKDFVELGKVEITNPLGQTMKKVSKDELAKINRIDVRELQNGTYYVLIQYRNSIIRIPLSILR